MAVIVSKANGGFSTVDNWYISYFYDFPTNSSGLNALSTVRSKPVTFSSNHNLLGVLQQLNANDPVLGNDRTVALDLLQLFGNVTVDSTTDYITTSTTPPVDNTLIGISASSMPGGLTAYERYYVRDSDAVNKKFKVATTATDNVTGKILSKVISYSGTSISNVKITIT